jgi:hypothetical protein
LAVLPLIPVFPSAFHLSCIPIGGYAVPVIQQRGEAYEYIHKNPDTFHSPPYQITYFRVIQHAREQMEPALTDLDLSLAAWQAGGRAL